MSFRPLSVLTAAEHDSIARLLQSDPILSFYWTTAIEDLALGIDNRLARICAGGRGAIIGAIFGDLTVFSPLGQIANADIAACTAWPGAVEVHAPLHEAERYRLFSGRRLLQARQMIVMECDLSGVRYAGAICRALHISDADRVASFYRSHYPDTLFDPYMLAMPFVGVFEGSNLVACAGTIALSGKLRAALIGHFVTAPTARNRGLARDVGSCLLDMLRQRGIASAYLATTADNMAALRVYGRLGFAVADRRCQIDLMP
ncbi:GNAT family N-acetyltransferase [Dongia sp.]|uniref:GNAT family N-acetyltransferase n=1 Tax=Dongia sp. TaxID=1977262 RepID=UPI0035B40F1D